MTTYLPAPKFETRTCGRCRGTGHYSFNAMSGSRCFGCGGAGKVLTAKGQRAREAWIATNSIPARDVRPGMLVRVMNSKLVVAEVEEPREIGHSIVGGERRPIVHVTLVSRKGNRYGVGVDSLVFVFPEA